MCFSGLFQFQAIFGFFLSLLDSTTKFIKLCTKSLVKQANFLPCKCTSLLLRIKPVQRYYLHIFKNFKTVHVLRVNETKLTSRNAFILHLFALGGENEPKFGERSLFWSFLQKLALSVNTQPPKDAYMRFSGLFQFQAFSDLFFLFLDLKSSLNCALNFGKTSQLVAV